MAKAAPIWWSSHLCASLAKVAVHVFLTLRYGDVDLTGAPQDASHQGDGLAPWRLHCDLCQQPGSGNRVPGVAGVGPRNVEQMLEQLAFWARVAGDCCETLVFEVWAHDTHCARIL